MKNILLVLAFFAFVIAGCGEKKENNTETKDDTKTTEKTSTDKTENKTEDKSDDKKNENTKDESNTDSSSVSEADLLGSWITDDEYKMGFDLKEGGKASSINMATLDYNSWKLSGNKLTLNSTSKGVSNPGTSDDIYIIDEITKDKLVISYADTPNEKMTYFKKK